MKRQQLIWGTLLAFALVLVPLAASAQNCVMCCPDCTCDPCVPPIQFPNTSYFIGNFYLDLPGAPPPVPVYSAAPTDPPAAQSVLVTATFFGTQILYETADRLGISRQAVESCRWQITPGLPPTLSCPQLPWDPGYFTGPFIWLFQSELREDLMMLIINLDNVFSFFGVPACYGGTAACFPWTSPTVPTYPFGP